MITEKGRNLCQSIMAPSTKKPNKTKVTNYIKHNPYSRRWCCNCHCTNVKPSYHQNIDVDELIWQLSNIQKHNQVTRRTWPISRGRMQRERNVHYRNLSLSPYERDSISRVSSESGTPSPENLTEPTDVASSSSVTPNFTNDDDFSHSYVENIGSQCSINTSRALLNKKSIVQIINNYIKAGIEEGKRQAKMYIRKALRFGVKSGYLIPADPQGQVLKISPTLANQRKIETQLRKKIRQTNRKVNDNTLQLVQRKTRKNTLPRIVKNNVESSVNKKPKRKYFKPKYQGLRKKDKKSMIQNSDEDIIDNKKNKNKLKRRGRPNKKIRTGRVEKRRNKEKRVSKRSTKKRRNNSKLISKNEENLLNENSIVNDDNNLDNEEKCLNVDEVNEIKDDDSKEFIGCSSSFSKHHLTDRENETRNVHTDEGEKCGNNEDQVDDSVLKRN
ncbi:hypothetical protein M0802_005924 [Mischocyttarus mexicanus]|nr:hypothetical protein M0802_005924 [Mischocyttarus mexicanus]